MPVEDSNLAGRAQGRLVAWCAIGVAAFAVEVPFFFHHGVPSGHDAEFHLYSWLEVLRQWHEGVVYPRWAALAQFGYGEPRFVFYPPASWTIGALLSAISPGLLAPAVYIWLCLAAAGSAMFALARRWLEPRDALFAAVLYTVNPYHLVIVYWRSAMAELLASCLFPLLLLSVLRAQEKRRYGFAGMVAVLAAGWLVNVPAAILMQYSFALLVVLVAWLWRSPEFLLKGALAVAMAAALSAFYLVPAAMEQRWISVQELTNEGYTPRDNFLFAHTPDVEHDAFLKMVSVVACVEIGVALAALGLANKLRRENRPAWWMLGGWTITASLLMLPISVWIWDFAPKMAFMQFPWRWLLPLGVCLALLVTAALQRWTLRAFACGLLLGVIVFAWQRMQAPWWDGAADLQEASDNVATGAGYEGAPEYAPVGTDASAVDKEARAVMLDGTGQAAIRVQRWDEQEREFTVDMQKAGQVALKLFQYPAWRVEVNGQPVTVEVREDTGQMLVQLDAGMNHVRVHYLWTRDRWLGLGISLLAALVFAALILGEFRHSAGRA